jgi:hypothetical protein
MEQSLTTRILDDHREELQEISSEIMELLLLQRNSNAYLEWISSENDIYDECLDECLKDAIGEKL